MRFDLKKAFIISIALSLFCSFSVAWDEPTRITKKKGDSFYPQVAASGSNVYLVWEDATSYPNRDIYFTKSTNEGFSWGPVKRIGWSGKGYDPQLVAYANKLHVFWLQTDFASSPYSHYGYSIIYIKSIDSGNTWSKPIILSKKAYASSFDVFIDKDNIHLVWIQNDYYSNEDYGIYYRGSIDGGKSWNKGARISKSILTNYNSIKNPSVCAYKNYVYLVWQDQDTSNQQKLLFKKSTDFGKTWAKPVLIKSNPGYNVHFHPDLVISGSTVHLVWDEPAISSSYRIVHKKSLNSGKTWTTNRTVYANSYSIPFSRAAVDANSVHLVWFYYSWWECDDVIDHLSSDDRGVTWSKKETIRGPYNYGVYCGYPSVSAFGGKVHVVWQEKNSAESDYGYEIYYSRDGTAD